MNAEHPREESGAPDAPPVDDAPTTRLPDDLAGDPSQPPAAATTPLPEAATTPLTPPPAAAETNPQFPGAAPDLGAAQDQAARQGAGAAQDPPHKAGARTGPIVWGALILAFCGFVLQRTVAPGASDPAVWITATVLGLGLLLLGVGVAVAIRSRR